MPHTTSEIQLIVKVLVHLLESILLYKKRNEQSRAVFQPPDMHLTQKFSVWNRTSVWVAGLPGSQGFVLGELLLK